MRWKRSLNVVDCHCEGEVGRVITGGLAQVPGQTMFDKKIYFQDHMDDIRKIVLFEPRGAVWHNANVILPSNHPEADMGFLIIETTEYPAMSGSNAICVATVLLETGILPMAEPVTDLTLEAPAGLIRLRCACQDGKVTGVRLVNQPAFVYRRDALVEVPGVGTVRVDVAFGGMTFALVEAADFGFAIAPDEARALCDLGEKITRAAAEQLPVSYPGNPQMAGISATVFTGPLTREEGILTARNTAVISPGRCDRSPCGAGSSARMALLYARGELGLGETFIHRSITGSRFTCAIDGLATVGPYDAIVPALAGQAWIAGLTQLGLDPTDPYQHGFTLSDTWFGNPI
ncbi:proline racemase family protein [Tabrizicola oligotrophica]|uniref:Proline racemase family protein n=1 Tax=Tabrizicola oligotrophica TaxID=2710650 RepID=A0A6M0QZ77_9RHOB|nr:proline racemase family protein [Tabrizicola oligotrophica]NEY92223.1 proline racemase family protein [Tabrizicola oligotrophica]